jgi:4-carboxymuconolactone decarboxylase
MPRVELVETREQASASQTAVFDQIVASRGKMVRPFAVMLHAPEVAGAVADLGAVLRYGGSLTDRVREVLICVTAHESHCDFEWDAHSRLARDAGVSDDTLAFIESGGAIAETEDAPLVAFARELCREGSITDEAFDPVLARLGESGTVEALALIGYYTLLAMVMNACQVC